MDWWARLVSTGYAGSFANDTGGGGTEEDTTADSAAMMAHDCEDQHGWPL